MIKSICVGLTAVWSGLIASFTDWQKSSFPAAWSALGKLVIIGLSAVIAIFAIPYVNAELEREKIRSAFYISTIDALNNDTKDILARFNILHEPLLENTERREILINLKGDIAKLHWRSVEFFLIYRGTEIEPVVERHQTSLEMMEGYLDSSKFGTEGNPRPIVEEFGLSSARLLSFLAEKAGIQVKN